MHKFLIIFLLACLVTGITGAVLAGKISVGTAVTFPADI